MFVSRYTALVRDIFQYCFNFPWTWAKFASCFAMFWLIFVRKAAHLRVQRSRQSKPELKSTTCLLKIIITELSIRYTAQLHSILFSSSCQKHVPMSLDWRQGIIINGKHQREFLLEKLTFAYFSIKFVDFSAFESRFWMSAASIEHLI